MGRAECQGGEGGQKASSGGLQRGPLESSAEHVSRAHWSGHQGLLQGHLPHPGIEPTLLKSPALAGECFSTSATWEAQTSTPLFKNWHICVTPRCVHSLFSKNGSRTKDFSVGITYLLKRIAKLTFSKCTGSVLPKH